MVKFIDDKIKLILAKYWLKNLGNMPDVPPILNNKITKDEALEVYDEIEPSKDLMGGTFTLKAPDIAKYINRLESKIHKESELTLTERQLGILDKQITIQEEVKNISKSTKNTQIAMVVVTIVLVIATFTGIYFDKKQLEKFSTLADRQLESIPQLKPDIQFFLKDDGTYPIRDLATPIAFKEDGTLDGGGWRKSRISLGIVNLGQNPAGLVNIKLFNNNLSIPTGRITFLGGTSTGNNTQIVPFFMWYNKCHETATEEECSRENAPNGVIPINISIRCRFCDQEIHSSFNICIYNRTEEQCSNFQI